jgi:peptide methionine sulfoxide reductase msrA/msrB
MDIIDNYDGQTAEAVFAGGCFWCVEAGFEKLPGVVTAISGFSGGPEKNPAYKEVARGLTGHREAVLVVYDPGKTTYRDLVYGLFKQIDPTDADGSFVDRGFQYSSAIYYNNKDEQSIAQAVITELDESGKYNAPIITPLEPFEAFYPAENYHQDYYKENPLKYRYYRNGSGRDQYLETIWTQDELHPKGEQVVLPSMDGNGFDATSFVKPSDDVLKEALTPLQYKVSQHEGTERPFNNEYWDNKDEGIYVDIVSGEPLYSSIDQYKSGTGWPSFTKPLEPANIVEKEDKRLFATRTEIRSKHGDNHIGHVFPDGPTESTGLRYCMNSAAMHFIPKERLEAEGYGEYLELF